VVVEAGAHAPLERFLAGAGDHLTIELVLIRPEAICRRGVRRQLPARPAAGRDGLKAAIGDKDLGAAQLGHQVRLHARALQQLLGQRGIPPVGADIAGAWPQAVPCELGLDLSGGDAGPATGGRALVPGLLDLGQHLVAIIVAAPGDARTGDDIVAHVPSQTYWRALTTLTA